METNSIKTIIIVEDSISGTEIDFQGQSIVAIRFPSHVPLASTTTSMRIITNKLEELSKEAVYFKFKNKPDQEYSVDVEALDDQIIIDFDQKDRIVGLAFLNLEYLTEKHRSIITKEWQEIESEYITNMLGNQINIDSSENTEVDESPENSIIFENRTTRRNRIQKERTPFILACCSGDISTLEKIYSENNNVIFEKDKQGSGCYLFSASFGQLEVLKWLLQRSPFDNNGRNDGSSPFIQAAARGHIHILEFMLNDCGFSRSIIDFADSNGDSPVMHAAGNGHLETVEYLIREGANLQKVSLSKSNCVHRAAVKGHVHMIEFLIRHGFDLNDATDKGVTALHYAVKNDHVGAVVYLLDHGAQIYKDNKGMTPVEIAKQSNKVELIEIFEKRNLF